jgi:hypothetical protein
LPQIARALISIEEDKASKTSANKVLKQQLLVEGYGLKEVMCIEGQFLHPGLLRNEDLTRLL